MNAGRHLAVIRSIVVKDLREFSRDRVWVVLTPIMLIVFVAIFWLLPSTIEEAVTIGVYQQDLDAVIDQLDEGESGLRVVEFASPEELEAAVASGEEIEVDGTRTTVQIGIAFPDGLLAAIGQGRSATVTVYVDSSVPSELRAAMSAMVREVTYQLAGVGLPVSQPSQELVVLGEDRVGDQVTVQETMRPLLALFVLLVESIALAGLVAVEIQSRTAKALVATPATIGDLLAAKGATGTLLAFGQAALLLLLTGSFAYEPVLLLVAVGIGSVMMAGVGMIAGSSGRDFMTTLFSSIIFILPLAIPAFAALFPGTASPWVQVLPTYGVVETLVGVTAYGLSWSGALGYLVIAAAWCVALFGAGWFLLKRRVEAL